MITFDPNWIQVLSLAVSVVLPLLVGLVTTRVTSGSVKAITLAVLSVATGLGSELLAALNAGDGYDLAAGLFNAATAFLIAVGLHFGLWKPTGAAGAVQDVGARHRIE